MRLTLNVARASSPRALACHRLGKHIPKLQSRRWMSGVLRIAVGEEARSDTALEDEELRRVRKTEWKRRQGGQTFLDYLVINVRAGRGGDGCVAFHRDLLVSMGPPSGGNGGRGGDVYIRAVEGLTTLSNVAHHVRAQAGGSGQGAWLHGKHGADAIIDVPVGTVVREVTDHTRARDAWEIEFDKVKDLDKEEGMKIMRMRRWLHYPQHEDRNVDKQAFQSAEQRLLRMERRWRWRVKARRAEPIELDFDAPSDGAGILVATGGAGGYGNPSFVTRYSRAPKYATRGFDGDWITLELQLKLVADVGLVGFPNAGKSTLLRALTNSKPEIASYAFTTLNPQIGIVKIWEDGGFGGREDGESIEETKIERARLQRAMTTGLDAPKHEAPTLKEVFRFTIADNPGLIEHASDNVGLGHTFLKSIERSLALAYVVDLSSPAPWDELHILENELEAYLPGLSRKARIVIANKADLLGGEDDAANKLAHAKLARLNDFVRYWVSQKGRPLDVVPVSAKHSQNLRRVVSLLRSYVEEMDRGSSDPEY